MRAPPAAGRPRGPAALDTRRDPRLRRRQDGRQEGVGALGDTSSDLQERLFAEASPTSATAARAARAPGDGHLRQGRKLWHTVGLVDPQGVRITSFKAPTEEELSHDFLWRIRTSSRGRAPGVFDRSALRGRADRPGPRVAEPEEIERRYGAINEFEAELVAGGTTVVKCMLHVSAASRGAAAGAARQPDQALEVQSRRHRRARPMGGLPRGLRDRARAHQHRGRALARGPERSQVVPQPGGRLAPAGRAAGWTRCGRPPTSTSRRSGGGSSRGPARVIPTVGGDPLRHAAPRGWQPARDRRGRRSRHLRLQVPWRRTGRAGAGGRGRGRRAGARIGLRTPRLVALELDPEIARYEADEEVQDLLNASPGLNLGVDFLPGAFGFDGDRPRRRGRRRPRCSGWTRSAPTWTGPGATPTCCSGTATCG